MNVWSNGTGFEILNTVYSIVSKIFAIVGALAERIRIAWEANGNGEAIWQSILNIVQSVLNFVDRIASATLAWANGLNMEPIISSFRGLLKSVEPLVDLILDGLYWAYTNVLLPLASFYIEDYMPAWFDFCAAAIDAFTAIVEALKPYGEWLWENFLKPLGKWTGEIIIAALKGITAALQKFSEWATENPERVQRAFDILLVALASILAYHTVHKIESVITSIAGAIKIFMATVGGISPTAFLAAVALAAITVAIIDLAHNWDKMNGVQKVVAVLGALVAAAFAAALAVGALQSSWSMGMAVAAIVAGILAMTLAINSAKSQAQSMGKSATSSLGGGNSSSLYSSMQSVPSSLPHLATGAVIPPNREFMAVLGDQKSGTNIEAPMGTIKQGIREVMNEMGITGGGQSGDIVLQVDGKIFARLMNPYAAKENQRVGIKMVEGVY